MNLIGTALAGIYVVVATCSASATSKESGESGETGVLNITCGSGIPTKSTVSHPDTTVNVTFPGTSRVERDSGTAENYIFDANCSERDVLSKLCPGATVNMAPQDGEGDSKEQKEEPTPGTKVTLWFPQLPASQQIVCVKSPDKRKLTKDCKAVITVAAAPPQGRQGNNGPGGGESTACSHALKHAR